MPPEIVRQLLWSAILFPRTFQLKRVRIHQENAARAVSAGGTKSAPINAVGTTMNCMRGSVSGLLDEFFGLDHLHYFWLPRVRLRIQDVNPGGTDARYD